MAEDSAIARDVNLSQRVPSQSGALAPGAGSLGASLLETIPGCMMSLLPYILKISSQCSRVWNEGRARIDKKKLYYIRGIPASRRLPLVASIIMVTATDSYPEVLMETMTLLERFTDTMDQKIKPISACCCAPRCSPDSHFNKDTEAVFERFQNGVSLVKDSSEHGYQRCDAADVDGLCEEFYSKVLYVCNKSKDNFLTRMYGGRIEITAMPPFNRKEVHESISQIATTIERLAAVHQSGKSFLGDFTLLISQICSKDWSSIDTKRIGFRVSMLRKHLKTAIALGWTTRQSWWTLIRKIRLTTGLWFREVFGLLVTRFLKELVSEFENVVPRGEKAHSDEEWHWMLEVFLGALAERRKARLLDWIKVNTEGFSSDGGVQNLLLETTAAVAEAKDRMALCSCKCEQCCILEKAHPRVHSCKGNHRCKEQRSFCKEGDSTVEVKGHTCRERCQFKDKSSNCNQSCSLKAAHQETRTYLGKRSTFKYDHVSEQNGVLENCCFPVPHEGQHSHSINQEAVHFCVSTCEGCGYFCHLPIGHPGLHDTVHDNMTQRTFVPESEEVEVGGRKYEWGDTGAAEMCMMHCKARGRGHIHLAVCEEQQRDGVCGKAKFSKGARHATQKYCPDWSTPKDELTHAAYWKKMKFKDPCSQDDQNQFALCGHYCQATEHNAGGTGLQAGMSYCTEKLWHPPVPKHVRNAGTGYVTDYGHHFACNHSRDVASHDVMSVVLFDTSGVIALERVTMSEPQVDKLLRFRAAGVNDRKGDELIERSAIPTRPRDGGVEFVRLTEARAAYDQARSLRRQRRNQASARWWMNCGSAKKVDGDYAAKSPTRE
ncbi:hypothetical protein SELMODRAFT_431728 [Selaginella moellendorffii]|uniref:Uncharacterized protein n=1 Tax=Selaginella moellendorffii TaxID=88036 RepID=D8TDL0_SELML|nr:hypothetical protein SELMODRAFT_431728 [Selaginella moellendorffii]